MERGIIPEPGDRFSLRLRGPEMSLGMGLSMDPYASWASVQTITLHDRFGATVVDRNGVAILTRAI